MSFRTTTQCRIVLAFSTLLSLSLAACDNEATAPEPTSRPSPDVVSHRDAPFYYHQGEQVRLTPDYTRIVVSASSLTSAASVTSRLADSDVAASTTSVLPQEPGHWVVELAPATVQNFRDRGDLVRQTRQVFDFAAPVYRPSSGGDEIFLLNRIIVRFHDWVTSGQIDSLNAALGTRIERRPNRDSNFVEHWLTYPSGEDVDPLSIAAMLDRHPLVQWADPDKLSSRKLQSSPSDSYYYLQFHLKNSTAFNGIPVDINVEPAWAVSKGNSSIRVAIIDDGIDVNHFDYDQLVAGFDAFSSPVPFQPDGNDSHGTAVAGIIAATHDNGRGVAGIAPNVSLNYARIFRGTSTFFPQVASDAKIAEAINWAWNNNGAKSDVISNSWGGGSPSNAITNAINAAISQGRNGKGTVVVFAAGNTSSRNSSQIGHVLYPATLPNVIAVGAMNRNGAVTNYTPRGNNNRWIDVVAPSGHYTGTCVGEVVTTDRAGASGCNDGPNGDNDFTQSFSGTSAAAPQVAGVAALLLSVEPNLTASQAKQRILTGADGWGPGSFDDMGNGKLNAYHTLVPRLYVSISGPTYMKHPGSYTWTAIPSGGTGTYSYLWQVSFDGENGPWYNAGTASSYTESYLDWSFHLRVTVSTPGEVAQRTVRIDYDGPCDPCYNRAPPVLQ